MSDFGEAHFEPRMSSAASDVGRASRLLRLLEDSVARRKRVTVGEARSGIARALRVPPKTLQNIRSERRKSIESSLIFSIRDRLIEALQAEIVEAEHQIAVARQIGLDHREAEFEQAVASIAAAKEILARAFGTS